MIRQLTKDLQKLSDPRRSRIHSRFFKTGKGEYGEGDIFLGLKVPQQRQLARKYLDLSFRDLQKLLNNKIHEYRLIALIILTTKYKKTKEKKIKKQIIDFYLKNTKNINNWDLVDLSAYHLLGDYLLNKDRSILYRLARSENLWKRRMAIVSTFAFIKQNQFTDTLKLAEILLKDKQDLIHKAVGWMLREVGKRNREVEERFLEKYKKIMPRTMLRYAIEKFEEEKRLMYLKTKCSNS